MGLSPSLSPSSKIPTFLPDITLPEGRTIDHILFSPAGLDLLEASVSSHPLASTLQHRLCLAAFNFSGPPSEINRSPLRKWITSRRVDFDKNSVEEIEDLQRTLTATLPQHLVSLAADHTSRSNIDLSNDLADLQQHCIDTILCSLPNDQRRKKSRLASRCKGRSSFKDGYSPELIILKDFLFILNTIRHVPVARRSPRHSPQRACHLQRWNGKTTIRAVGAATKPPRSTASATASTCSTATKKARGSSPTCGARCASSGQPHVPRICRCVAASSTKHSQRMRRWPQAFRSCRWSP